MITVTWKGGMAFESIPPSGNRFVMDAYHEVGGQDKGPTPVEALLSSLGACSAMDVIAFLRKEHQKVTEYRVEVEGERGPGGVYPRPYTSISVKHILMGENLDAQIVQRAVELSRDKYCTVLATLNASPKVAVDWTISS